MVDWWDVGIGGGSGGVHSGVKRVRLLLTLSVVNVVLHELLQRSSLRRARVHEALHDLVFVL